jgi:imidazolonepropionase
MTDLSIFGAEEILLPPEPGLPHLRGDRASELTLGPGSISVAEGWIEALDDDAGAAQRMDAGGCSIVPGFVDCHTSLPWAGFRAGDYARLVAGEQAAVVERGGGGVRGAAADLAAADDEEVLAQAGRIADEMLYHGTTTLEARTGYGLERQAELRQLRLAAELADQGRQDVAVTALLAHRLPEGWAVEGWLGEVEHLLPAAQSSATVESLAVDAGVFDAAAVQRLGELARRHGMMLRVDAERRGRTGVVPGALEAGARALDGLAHLDEAGVKALAAAPAAAVLLPAEEYLTAERLAPGGPLSDAGAICALATGANPVTAPVASLPLVIALAVRHYRWTVREALLASTLNAAWVLDRSDEVGSIETGKAADLVVLDGPVEQLPFRLGHNPVVAVVVGGELVYVRPGQAWRVKRA